MSIVIHSAFNHRTEQLNTTRVNLRQMAYLISSHLQDVVFSTHQMGSTLSRIPEVRNHSSLLLQQILTDRLKMNPYCSAVVIADKSGNVIASAPRQDNLHSIVNRKSFRNARDSRLFSSGGYNAENASGSTFFSFSYPLIDADGVFDGTIEIEINRNIFELIHKYADFDTRPNFTIVDSKGVILYSHLHPQFVGNHDRDENFAIMQRGNNSGDFFTGLGNDGILRLLYFRKSYLEHENTPYVFIRASKPSDTIVEAANRDLLLNTLFLSAFTMAAFFLVWVIGRRSIADRIKTLETAAMRLADGDLGIRASRDVVGGELGRLAGAFDQMAQQLEKRDWQLMAFDNELIAANSKLHTLNQKIEETREEERHTIARELHDQMGQALTGLSLDLNWLVAQLDQKTVQKLDSHLIDMHIIVESMIAMVQNITARLSPPLLDNLGLTPAIGYYVQEFERKSDIVCHLMLDEGADSCFRKDESISIFRILQESLTNVARHADAVEVAVSLCLAPQSVILEVADNGTGITDEAISSPNAFGVLGMQERAKKCGGSLLIQGNPGGGTIVRLEIPLRKGEIREENFGS